MKFQMESTSRKGKGIDLENWHPKSCSKLKINGLQYVTHCIQSSAYTYGIWNPFKFDLQFINFWLWSFKWKARAEKWHPKNCSKHKINGPQYVTHCMQSNAYTYGICKQFQDWLSVDEEDVYINFWLWNFHQRGWENSKFLKYIIRANQILKNDTQKVVASSR